MVKDQELIKAIILDDDIAKISVMEVPDSPGMAFGLFSALSKENIKVESIVQNVNRNAINDITFTVTYAQLDEALTISRAFKERVGAKEVIFDREVARLSVIGSGIVANTDVATRFFKALYEQQINIQMISTSEVKISCVVSKACAQEALKAVYREFELAY